MTTKSTICILDDEPIVGDRLKPEMEDDGYEVEVFTDSDSAIKRLQAHNVIGRSQNKCGILPSIKRRRRNSWRIAAYTSAFKYANLLKRVQNLDI